MSDERPIEAIPLILPVDLAGELLGTGRAGAYAAAKTGALPLLPGPGRKKVPTAALERLCGRRITAGDIDAARARLAPKRAALLKYGADYRAERDKITNRNRNRPSGGAKDRVPPCDPQE